jgi:hypothetical protein
MNRNNRPFIPILPSLPPLYAPRATPFSRPHSRTPQHLRSTSTPSTPTTPTDLITRHYPILSSPPDEPFSFPFPPYPYKSCCSPFPYSGTPPRTIDFETPRQFSCPPSPSSLLPEPFFFGRASLSTMASAGAQKRKVVILGSPSVGE